MSGTHTKYAAHPATFCGKPTSMLFVDGMLYTWVSSWFNESTLQFCSLCPEPGSPRTEACMVTESRCHVDPFAMESKLRFRATSFVPASLTSAKFIAVR